MMGVAAVMALLALAGIYLIRKKQLMQRRWFLWLLVASLFVPYIGNSAGWVLAEIGRQPWLVFGQLKTNAGVSTSVSPAVILFSLIAFIVLYGILAVVDAYLLVKTARQGMPPVEDTSAEHEPQEELATAY